MLELAFSTWFASCSGVTRSGPLSPCDAVQAEAPVSQERIVVSETCALFTLQYCVLRLACSHSCSAKAPVSLGSIVSSAVIGAA